MIRTAPWLGALAALLIASTASHRDAVAQPVGGGNPHANLGAGPHANLGPRSGVADVPAGPATIRGKVVHRSRPEATGGVPVNLFALGADGRPGTRGTETDPSGAFSFEGISNDPGTVYLIAVQFGEIPFGGRTTFRAGQTESTSVIEIADASADAGELGIGAVHLRIDRGCNGVRITETHELRNPTDFVFHVPLADRATHQPILRFDLPPAATLFTPGRGASEEGMQPQGDEVAYWGPLRPGTHAVEFSYSIPGRAETLALERRFRRGAEKAVVMSWAGGPPARGEGLEPAAEENVAGLTYNTVESGALAPGENVAFSLDLGAVEPSADLLSITELNAWLELDDAALDVREQFQLDASGHSPLRSMSDAPLLCLSLPPGAEELRLSAEAFSLGIQPDAGGGLAVHGPIPPGRSGFAMSYLLRSGSDGARFTREFPLGISLLSLMIADTGVKTTTDRLHRLRPIRTSDRTYIHLEGFEIEPGETVEVDLESLRLPRPLPRVASIGFIALAAVLAVVFLAAPLRGRRDAKPGAAAAASTADERASVYAAIRDLEDDFATGKVSAEDHAVMLGELRARAGALLREERAASAAATGDSRPAEFPAGPVAGPRTPAACASCGATLHAGAQFCSQCGARISTAAAPGGSGE